MAPRYHHSHSIDAILECPEDAHGEVRGARAVISDNKKRRDDDPSTTTTTTTTTTMASTRTKDKPKKSHRSSTSSRHSIKSKPKANSAKRYAAHGDSQSLVRQHQRHRRETHSDSSSSSSSSEDEQEGNQDHHAILAAARSRLTSPSLVSTLTSLTTATNNSSGSSGSNSTITQASMSRSNAREVTISGTTEEEEEGPLSPGMYRLASFLPGLTEAAAPDPPNVFAYLDEDDSSSDEEEEHDDDGDEDEDEEEHYAPHALEPVPEAPHLEEAHDYDEHTDDHPSPTSDIHPQTAWLHPLSPSAIDDATPHASTFHPRTPSLSSSSSSAISDTSSHPFDADTDRSTSPEQSLKGSPSPPIPPRLVLPRPPSSPPLTSPSEEKLAAQMRAAHQRQNLHSPAAYHQRRHPHRQQHHPPPLALPQPPYPSPYPPSHPNMQALSPRHHQEPIPPPRLPPSGYEALSLHLSTHPPIYRRFATLNHRLLLHMQDELCELEDHLSALDAADAASRTFVLPPSPSSSSNNHNHNHKNGNKSDKERNQNKTITHPSSRRASSTQPTPIDHHRLDLLNRLSYKLAQYNATLSSFAKISKLPAAEEGDVEGYRRFLREKHPVVDAEAGFLERGKEELVSLAPPPPVVVTATPTPPAPTTTTTITPPTTSPTTSPPTSSSPTSAPAPATTQRTLLLASLSSILLPVLMFTVVPNFVGRIAVSVLVAGMLWGMVGGSSSSLSGGGGGTRGGGIDGGWGLLWGWGAGILIAAVVV